MQEIDKDAVVEELQRHTVASELASIKPEAQVYGFRHNGESDFIATLSVIEKTALPEYLAVLDRNFGGPLKEFDAQIELGVNVPEEFVKYLNRLHGNTFGGTLLRNGSITIVELASILRKQGGGIEDPPLNLTNRQALYGRRPGSTPIEIVRVCPWTQAPIYTLEYMVSVGSSGDS